MLEKIKKFVKSITPTTWMLVAVGAAAGIVLGLSVASGKPHKKHVEQKTHIEVPAGVKAEPLLVEQLLRDHHGQLDAGPQIGILLWVVLLLCLPQRRHQRQSQNTVPPEWCRA